MTEHAVADLADTVCWVLGEIEHMIDPDLPPLTTPEPPRYIDKVPQCHMDAWKDFRKWVIAEVPTCDAQPKFRVNEELNEKIFIGNCDILQLEVGATAVFVDEFMPHASRTARRIQTQYGNDIPYEELGRLRCGDVMLRRSYNIGSEHVVYAVSPRYSAKYPDASANILNMCVRETLKAAIAAGVDSVAFPLAMGREVTYPDREFATAVLRAVRRWLEVPKVATNIARVFFFGVDEEAYRLMQRFFPRDQTEEKLSAEISDAGNEFGEIVKEERNIRISAGLRGDSVESDGTAAKTMHINAPLANFSGNCRVGSDRQLSAKDYDFDYYCRLSLSLMRTPVYREMDTSKFALLLGRDVAQRPVIAIDAARMPSSISNTHAVAYVLRIMQPILQNKFAMLLLNMDSSLIAAGSVCSVASQLFQVLGDVRLGNLGVVYVHRAGWATRGMLYVMMVLLPDAVRDSVTYVDTAESPSQPATVIYITECITKTSETKRHIATQELKKYIELPNNNKRH
ncbi:-Ganglioside-induced differentiation-associated protein 2 [Babesia bigemina]|uniref:-Ganglioside-induced differentiation-associated protein 2 n=1 Tax=Babesia bigemina TaxID=5866 RepID=A0A061DCB2_BABBI|nr:-Ganglioside-induced differentiation-associated protein 2 [Babesia bigemina]CDR97697.1 -Ganglioside-induced differentiation-associated protein 2 [Babesia bigemina]|eukprot:XP_012769883.1 -Ganglioside-induced differentiation-associated protein 2 [Babesia bigemina]